MRLRHAAAALLLLCFTSIGFAADKTMLVTPELVGQIQFMLKTVGIDPGPIDNNPQTKTNNAIRTFETTIGLPPSNLKVGGQVSQETVDKLREAALAKFGVERKQPPPVTTPPVVAAPSPAAAVPPPDRFAACRYDSKDFAIGTQQYTPQTFLDQGFNGSTDEAVNSLRVRLTEARKLADQNRGAALMEVQRQARVLGYFECRQKIENPS